MLEGLTFNPLVRNPIAAARLTAVCIERSAGRSVPGCLVSSEGLRPSDSSTRALARGFAGALRSRGSLAMLARTRGASVGFVKRLPLVTRRRAAAARCDR